MKLTGKFEVRSVSSEMLYDLGGCTITMNGLKVDRRRSPAYGCIVSSKKSPSEPGHFSHRTAVWTKRSEALKDAARTWKAHAKIEELKDKSYVVALPCGCIVAAVVADPDATSALMDWIGDGRNIVLASDDDVRTRFRVNCGHPLAPNDELSQMRMIL